MSTQARIAALAALLLTASPGAASAAAADKEAPELLAMDGAVTHYVALCADLATGQLGTHAGHLRALEAALTASGKGTKKAAIAGSTGSQVAALAREASAAIAPLLEELRNGFTKALRPRLFALSKPLVRYAGRFRAGGKRWKTYYCSMAKGSWLQVANDSQPSNPYYGGKMLRCGDPVRTRGEG